MNIRHSLIRLLVYSIIGLLTIPLLWNLLRPGFYTSDDGEWMVIRLTAFHDALRQGQFPVRWLPRLNHGYGYPVANFLYPLPFYLSEPIYFLTGNPATAVQFIMAISIISMALGMFALISPSSLKKNWPALVGSLTYVYSPYVAFNLYQRGSLGEIVAMGIVPWIFWAISRNKLPLAAILAAGLILSHNVVAILFFPLALIYAFYKTKKNHAFLILALSLSAFFWLPALAELRFVRAGQISVSDFQNEYLKFTEALNRTGIVTAIFSAGSPLFFLTKSSSWLWETMKFAQVIQFPWRLLSLFSFVAAVASAKLVTKISGIKIINFIIGIIIIILSFASSVKYLIPASFVDRPPEYYQTNDDTTTVRAEYTPIWVTDLPQKLPETPQVHYYPGWKIFIDGKETPAVNPTSTNGILLPTTSLITSENIMSSAPEKLSKLANLRVRLLPSEATPSPPQAGEWVTANEQISANEIAGAKLVNIKYRFTETPLRTFANLLSIAAALTWLKWLAKQPKSNPRATAAVFP